MPFFDFFAGATTPSSFPPETLPEIGFVGRSNVGKSTMLNSLGNSTMARVSEKPGMTQQINFYSAGKDFHIVDMPGYGFAYAKESVKETWVPLATKHSTNCNNQVFMVSARSNGGKGSGFNELRKEILHMMGLGKKYLAGVKRQEALARTQQQEILAKKNNKQGKRKRE
ncbi:hypothetical protein EV182_004172 [Spiromyces aspiralis]|uniref:Uncharacterized protein n=1 Tax=Spiromyces aspiralis TaxID=68401 RepID=A0ACC1HQ81_9FUNG|nr:hypothetical protein EV182_004172 [Spiromyces aspiralis]